MLSLHIPVTKEDHKKMTALCPPEPPWRMVSFLQSVLLLFPASLCRDGLQNAVCSDVITTQSVQLKLVNLCR